MNSELRPDLGRRGGPRFGRAEDIIVHALRSPRKQTLVVLEPRKLRSATLGEHGNVDRGMKAGRRRDGSLPNGVHQPQRAKILEDARPSGPWNLTILRSPQRFKYRFVGIRGHLDSFLKCRHDTASHGAMPRGRRCPAASDEPGITSPASSARPPFQSTTYNFEPPFERPWSALFMPPRYVLNRRDDSSMNCLETDTLPQVN